MWAVCLESAGKILVRANDGGFWSSALRTPGSAQQLSGCVDMSWPYRSHQATTLFLFVSDSLGNWQPTRSTGVDPAGL